MANNVNLQDILDYYANLLILQYKNKPKARATIQLLVKQIFSNLLIFFVERAFDIDTAIGAQLDILVKYIGCKRTLYNYVIERTYFEFNDVYSLNTYTSKNGFSEVHNTTLNWGLIFFGLGSEYNKGTMYSMNDAELRLMAKFLIIKNNTTATFYSVLNNVYSYFGNDILLIDNMDMTWTIKVNKNYSNLIQICLSQDWFPRPQGVDLILVINP